LDRTDEAAEHWWRGVAEVNKRPCERSRPSLANARTQIVGAVAQVNEARSAVEAALAADRLNSLGGTFGDRYSAVLAELLLVDAREAKASWDERFAV
jgi:hypothetical protein